MKKEYFTFSPSETKKLGRLLGERILKEKKGPVILALIGELGGGKTTFLKGLALGLGIKDKILSPTFIIIKKFPLGDEKFKNFYHIDCYRINQEKELLVLDFKKILSNPRNIIAIEWANKIKNYLPKQSIQIKFSILSPRKRKITITKLEKL